MCVCVCARVCKVFSHIVENFCYVYAIVFVNIWTMFLKFDEEANDFLKGKLFVFDV